jgi:hypothetical protein
MATISAITSPQRKYALLPPRLPSDVRGAGGPAPVSNQPSLQAKRQCCPVENLMPAGLSARPCGIAPGLVVT